MPLSSSRIISLAFLFVSGLFAQTADISGKYEGTADVQGLGKLPITAELRHANGKVSGIVHTPLGETPIIEGTLKDGIITLKVDAGGDDIFLSGKVSNDGKITGEVSGDTAKGTFELKRTGNATLESVHSVVLTLSKEKWREDLRFLAAELPKKHKNAFHRITREQFEKSVSELDAKIPTLSDEEVVLGLARIVAQIGDGHTGLGWGRSFQRVPMDLFWFGKELRVIRVAREFPRLNGARLIKISGVGVERIHEQARDYISQVESEQFVLDNSAYLFTHPVLLKVLGLTNEADKASYEFIDRRGKRFSIEMMAKPRVENRDWLIPNKTTPLYLLKPAEPLLFEHLKDAKAVYVNFKWYPRRPEFRKFSKELFELIDNNDVQKLVFDLRQNGGGDFTRGRDFFIKPLKECKKFSEKGRLFVITGRETYSAAMANAADFRNDLKAILVGEPTGARPNGYQENRGFSLPNSHLPVSYSIEFYKFSETDTPGILPDKIISPEWKPYLAGRDRALEWILAYPKYK